VHNAVMRYKSQPLFYMYVICSVTSDTYCVLFLLMFLVRYFCFVVGDTCLCWLVTWVMCFTQCLGTLCVSCLRSASSNHVKRKFVSTCYILNLS
jgi:hypothetical protein